MAVMVVVERGAMMTLTPHHDEEEETDGLLRV